MIAHMIDRHRCVQAEMHSLLSSPGGVDEKFTAFSFMLLAGFISVCMQCNNKLTACLGSMPTLFV